MTATKAWAGAIVAAVLGFLAPGAAYLLTVDENGITGAEIWHAALIAVVTAAVQGGATGYAVWRAENKPKP